MEVYLVRCDDRDRVFIFEDEQDAIAKFDALIKEHKGDMRGLSLYEVVDSGYCNFDCGFQGEDRGTIKFTTIDTIKGIDKSETYVIFSPSEQGWWSNSDGWANLGLATHFTREEKLTFHHLPMGGHWHTLKTAEEYNGN